MAWNRPDERKVEVEKKGGQRNVHLKGLLAGVIVVLGAMVFWFFSSQPQTSNLKPQTSTSRIKAVTPAAATKSEPKRDAKGGASEADGEATVPVGQPSVGQPSAGQDSAGQPDKPKVKRVFEHSTDQLIAMAMTSSQGGASIPPLPGIGSRDNKEFLESLKRPVRIDDDDTESVKAVKQLVQQTRDEIVQLMEENPNMSFSDILQEHRKIHNENIDIKAQTTRELQKIIDEGDIEGAKKFRTTMNFALQQMGISEITTPITEEEKAEAEAAEEINN